MESKEEYIKVVPLKRSHDTKISSEDFFRGDDVAKIYTAKKSLEEDEPNRIKGWEKFKGKKLIFVNE